MKKNTPLLITLATIAGITAAMAGGAYQNFPIVGVPANTDCQSYGNNNVCNQYRPAGPNYITGNEIIPADTQLPGGQNPQTVDIPVSMLGVGNGANINALIGGDFNTNLWQRGTTFTAATPTTAAYTADRWFMYSSGNTVTITRQTSSSGVSLSDQLNAVMRVARPSGTDVTPICVGQVLPAKEASRFLGKNAIFSFYASAPTTLTSVNDSIDVTIAYVTAADSATPNTITDSFAKSTTTGYTQVVTKANGGASGTTITSASANIGLSATPTRYFVSGAIPTTATSVGVKICMTNVGTGASTDYFEFGNAQLEAGAVTSTNYLGQTAPSPFAKRPVAYENVLQQSFTYALVENTGVFYAAPVTCTASGAALIGIQYGTQMRMTPTLTLTAGGFSIQTAAAVTAIGTTTLAAATTQHASLTSAAACTTTLPYQLKGTNTTGLILLTAEP